MESSMDAWMVSEDGKMGRWGVCVANWPGVDVAKQGVRVDI